jgi:hypothetical protein
MTLEKMSKPFSPSTGGLPTVVNKWWQTDTGGEDGHLCLSVLILMLLLKAESRKWRNQYLLYFITAVIASEYNILLSRSKT